MSLDEEYILRREAQLRRKVDRLTGPARAEALAAMELRKVVHYPEKGYKMAKTQQQLLDEWRLILLAWLLLLAMFVIGILIGAWGAVHGIDTGGQAAAFSVSGMIGAVGTTVLGGCWFHWHNKLVVADRDGRKYNVRRSPASRVLAAERAHRNHILEQG